MWRFYALLWLSGAVLPSPLEVPSASTVSAGPSVPEIGGAANPSVAATPSLDVALEALLPAHPASPHNPDGDLQMEQAFAALARRFPLPDIVTGLEAHVQELAARRRGVEAARARPAPAFSPRKRNIDPGTAPVMTGQAVTAALAELEALEAACARLAGLAGDHAYAAGLLTTAFQGYAMAILLAAEQWKDEAAARQQRFLEAAAFMVLTAHRSGEVLALYQQVPMDRDPLDRQIVAQMERWLTVYTQAPPELASFSGTQRALGDLLFVLIEDPAADAIVPVAERRRLLQRLAAAAVDHYHFAEAVGAYSRLGDKEALKKLGRRLARSVVVETDERLLVQREVELAIDALAEAGDREGLEQLLKRCRDADRRVGVGDKPVVNEASLALFIQRLEARIGSGAADERVIAELGQAIPVPARASTVEMSGTLSDTRLAELIEFYRSRSLVALGDEERRQVSAVLGSLEEEALKRGRLELALKAASVRDGAGMALIGVGERAVQAHDWTVALEAYRAAGPPGLGPLRSLGDRLTGGRSIVMPGDINPSLLIAVDAYLAAEALDRLEPLYGSMLAARDVMTRQGAEAGEARGILETCMQRIEATYDLVAREPREVAKVPASPPARTKSRRRGTGK